MLTIIDAILIILFCVFMVSLIFWIIAMYFIDEHRYKKTAKSIRQQLRAKIKSNWRIILVRDELNNSLFADDESEWKIYFINRRKRELESGRVYFKDDSSNIIYSELPDKIVLKSKVKL